ncbi:hypothetical protein ES702_02769 [subsurface metagenome]
MGFFKKKKTDKQLMQERKMLQNEVDAEQTKIAAIEKSRNKTAKLKKQISNLKSKKFSQSKTGKFFSAAASGASRASSAVSKASKSSAAKKTADFFGGMDFGAEPQLQKTKGKKKKQDFEFEF